MAFMDLTKKELVEAADYYSVDIDSNDTKQEITDALEESGVTWEQYEEDHAEPESPEVTEEPVVESETEPEPADETEESRAEEPEEEPEDMVLVRFIGRNRTYQVGKWAFSQTSPFALMTKPEYDSLDRFKFREATKSEATEFYS